jgi:cell division septation protein DedD
LVGLFLGVVLLCGVFFTLGYVMGHNQYGGPVHAADVLEKPSIYRVPAKAPEADTAPAPALAPANSEWDFYSKKSDNRLEPPPTQAADTPAPAAPAPRETTPPVPTNNPRPVPASARYQAPRLVKGSIVLQVAALRHQSDALAMADALQQKNFPAFVVAPNGDAFYHVQVGPYSSQRTAESARAALDHAGFKAILKH